MYTYVFQLFIAGTKEEYRTTIERVRKCCQEQIGGDYDLQIVNVLEQPELAEREKIMAIPALIKRSPVPVQQIVGDLSKTGTLLLEAGNRASRTGADPQLAIHE